MSYNKLNKEMQKLGFESKLIELFDSSKIKSKDDLNLLKELYLTEIFRFFRIKYSILITLDIPSINEDIDFLVYYVTIIDRNFKNENALCKNSFGREIEFTPSNTLEEIELNTMLDVVEELKTRKWI